MKTRGFTLIELLITVFIIGLLASIVLASLSGARNKGNDTGVKAEINTIATQAVLYYGLANSYGAANVGSGIATCDKQTNGKTVFYDQSTTVDTPIMNSITTLKSDANGGVKNYPSNLACRSDDQRFMIAAQLSNGHWYCADYTASTTILGPVEVTSLLAANKVTCQ